jgi:pimeloyl-ACP methyl ester carboxylesterase
MLVDALEKRVLLTAPLFSNFDFNFETGHSLGIDFNVDVRPGQGLRDGLQNTDLVVQKVGPVDSFIPTSSIVLNNPAPGTHGTFTFINQPLFFSRTDILPDGNYRASISSQDVADGTIQFPEEMEEAGFEGPRNAVENFFVLSGDANRDTNVNLQDFNIVAANFGMTGRTFSQGNFNYDPAGNVNLQDFNVIAAQFGASMPAPPTAPNQITVGNRADFKFDLAWMDGVSGEDGWRVQYSLSGQFDDAVYLPDLPANSIGTLTPAFVDGTRVWWRSRAFSNTPGGPDSAYSPKRYGITPLPEPTITSATALSPSQIRIVFTDNSQNETSFQVYRSISFGGQYLPVGDPIPSGGSAHTFTDGGLNPNTTYYYRVQARNAVTDSAPSNTANATTQIAGITLNATLFSADQIDLAWSAFAGANTYKIELSLDGVDFHESIDIQGTETSTSLFGFEEAQSTQNHYIQILALNASGQTIATSNVRNITSPTTEPGDTESGPDLTPENTKLLVPINGLFPPGGGNLTPYGNRWFEMMTRDTGLSIKATGDKTYRYNETGQAIRDLLARIDANGDRVITAAEDQAADVILAGYSWGGISAGNIARKLRDNSIFAAGVTFTLQVDVSVELVISIDPVRRGPFGVAKVFKPMWGPVQTNAARLVNWYQRRGLSTAFDLYLPGSSNNGQNFNTLFRVDQEVIPVPFEGLKGDTMPHRLAASNVVQVNVTDLFLRYATNVEFFKNPLLNYPNNQTQGNWFDGDLVAGTTQHDSMPFYVRGGIGAQFANDLNWTLEIENV